MLGRSHGYGISYAMHLKLDKTNMHVTNSLLKANWICFPSCVFCVLLTSLTVCNCKTEEIPVDITPRRYHRVAEDLYCLAKSDFILVTHFRERLSNYQEASEIKELAEWYIQDFMTDCVSFSEVCIISNGKNLFSKFRLLRRRSALQQSLDDLTDDEDAKSLIAKDWPLNKNANELLEAARFIGQLRVISSFNISDFVSGNFGDRATGPPLRAIDCMTMGGLLIPEDKCQAMVWLKEALRIATETGDTSVDMDSLQDLVVQTENPAQSAPENLKSDGSKQINWEMLQQYSELCSGSGDIQTPEKKSHLFCWLEFKIHPELAIGPLKMEFLSRSPDIIQTYDVISPSEAEPLRHLEPPLSETHALYNRGILYLDPQDQPPFLKQKSKLVANLESSVHDRSLKTAALSVYGFAGSLWAHLDAATEYHEEVPGKDLGNRLVTFIYYLNNVGLGGNTAFGSAGTGAKPIQGSAVFWFNLHTDGTCDQDVLHAACPVLRGEKWIVTKWIREYEQPLQSSWKCSLNPGERYHFPVNGILSAVANDH